MFISGGWDHISGEGISFRGVGRSFRIAQMLISSYGKLVSICLTLVSDPCHIDCGGGALACSVMASDCNAMPGGCKLLVTEIDF